MKYSGGITILREYAAKKAEEYNRKAVIRFETEPGYQAQVDWKILNTQWVNGKLQKLYAFTMVLGYSRKPFVIHTLGMDQSTLLICHILAFEYFGGIPAEILYDNMKTAFIYSEAEGKWKPNKHLLSLARHYGFIPRRCMVRRPQTKGKVERFIHYYQNNFWIEYRNKPLVLDELNEAVLDWIDSISNKKISGLNESRHERFAHEQKYLSPLPKVHFDCRRPVTLHVSGESLVRVKNNWYSVPPQYIGKELTLRIDPLSQVAEISEDKSIIRTFIVNNEGSNQRYYLKEHKDMLKELWKKQYRPNPRKKKLSDIEVNIRSPKQYEELFSIQEAVS